MLERLRGQALRYGAELRRGTVTALAREDGGFIAGSGSETLRARTVLMATGLIDKKPQTAGLADGIVHGAIRFCPICDGYEASDKRIGVLGPFETAAHKALFMRTYSRDVRLFSTDRVEAPELSGELAAAGIDVAGIAARVDPSAEGVSVTVEGGKTHVLDVLYPALGCIVRSELDAALGAKCSRVGTLNVDDRQSTTIDGLFGAGDVVADLHQLSVATGHAAIAATAVHNRLARNAR